MGLGIGLGSVLESAVDLGLKLEPDDALVCVFVCVVNIPPTAADLIS